MPTTSPILISWADGAPPPELDEADLRAALAGYLAALGHPGAGLSVLFADDARLRELNREQRGLDRPTDILSWSYEHVPAPPAPQAGPHGAAQGTLPGTPPGTPPTGAAGLPLGELALSLERAAAQAATNGWSLRSEVLRLLAHGCAHVMGHDHRTAAEDRAMLALELKLLEGVGLAGLYPGPIDASRETPGTDAEAAGAEADIEAEPGVRRT